MATCNFCQQRFENSQAVRAHLKGCAAYRQRHGRRAPKGSGSEADSLGTIGELQCLGEDDSSHAPGEYDEVTALEKRLASARLRLKLRGVEQAHAELDERAQAKANERESQAAVRARATEQARREQEESHRRTEQSRLERERREKAERERTERRRAVIQQVKRDATTFWWPAVPDVTTLKSAVLRAIESELATLAVEELPRDELMLIAEGIRDKLTREATSAQDVSRRLCDKRANLIEHGIRYGDRELDSVDGLRVLDKWPIQARIKQELSEIGGDETRTQIEELVEGVLESEGLGWDDDEEDAYEDD